MASVMECYLAWSLRLDVGGSDHLGPLLGFAGDEHAEIAWRATEDNAAEVRELSPQLGIGEAGIDLLVEHVDDVGRCVCRCAETEPCARLVARHEVAHYRNFRQYVSARCGGHRQRAELAGSDVRPGRRRNGEH